MAIGALSSFFGGGAQGVAAQQQTQNTDTQNAETIQTQIAATDQTDGMQRFQILQDAQTKTNQIIQEVAQNSAKTSDQLADKWDQILTGGGGGN